MRPGITVQHTSFPRRRTGLVRCDVTAIIGFIPPARWPEGASRGDFVAIELHRDEELRDHPLRTLFTNATRRAVRHYFANGGDTCHLFGVCLRSRRDLRETMDLEGAFTPLFERLRVEEDIAIVVVPDAAYLPIQTDRQGRVEWEAETLFDRILDHCQEMGNRFFVMDPPEGVHGAALEDWTARFAASDTESRSFGALYYPWLYRGDTLYPPSASLAGVYARTEREHEPFGVVWPPGNVQVRGATHPAVDLDWTETGALAELGINPLVVQPARGVVVWGTRTLSRDSTWQNINSRRVASMVAEQLRRDNEWAVFENNDWRIWKVLERDVGVRLKEFWQAGVITGEGAEGDYLVKCDHETNPPNSRETGTLSVQVRLRPIGTVEHITIDLRLGRETV